jgi:SAM-dependent methyltransferase
MDNKNMNWSKINSCLGSSSSESLGYSRPCPICGSLHSKNILELSDFQFYSDSIKEPKRFNVRENICLNCFAVYLNPVYSNYGFNVLFAEAGQSYGSMSGHTEEQIKWLTEHKLLSEKAKVLDVGCFDGGFLSLLPDNVIKLGVDIDKPAILRGREMHHEKEIQFFHGDFETFSYDSEAPDTITMYHVLEHVPRPVEVLRKLNSISHDTTKLVIEVPVLDNGNTNDLHGFFSIQHTTHFSRNSLRNCLYIAGWSIQEEFMTSDYNGFRVLASPLPSDHEYKEIKAQPKDWIDTHDSLMSWHKSIIGAEKSVQSIPEFERYVIWGAGAHSEYLYQLTTLFHGRPNCEYIIVDSDPLKQTQTWRGLSIYDPSEIKNNFSWDSTGLIVSSYGSQDIISEIAMDMGVPSEKIIKFYDDIRLY